MKQEHMPLVEALEKFNRDDPAYFCIPAHRGGAGITQELAERWGEEVFCFDRTETDGLDDLHHPEQAILQAQKLAASLFGADRSWFLVNGTTCGNEAMILACAGPGERIAVPRNAHKSVCMGLILSGAIPVWMQPQVFEDWGFAGEILPETVAQTLEEHPDIRAVLLTSPTYQGVCSDLRQIAEICHERGIPLLVDEAHGAHLYFHESLPVGALQQGADLCVQSTHKTLGGLTQSSMLHMQGKLVSPDRVDDALKLVQSTSPSYLLMVSLDAARRDMALRGHQELEKAILLAEKVSRELEKIPGVHVFNENDCGITGESVQKETEDCRSEEKRGKNRCREEEGGQKEWIDCPEKAEKEALDGKEAEEYSSAISGQKSDRKKGRVFPGKFTKKDPLRLVFSTGEAGLSGLQLKQKLYDIDRISLELAETGHALAIISFGNTERDARRLVRAVRIILEEAQNSGQEKTENLCPKAKTGEYPLESARKCAAASAKMSCETEVSSADIEKRRAETQSMTIPDQVLSPREAYFSGKTSVPLEKAEGQVAGEMIAPYPPGIPLLYPGERISKEIVSKILNCRRLGIPVHGAADPSLQTIRILR